MKTPLQKVIERLEDEYSVNDGHTGYQEGIKFCIDVCWESLQYERDVVKHIADVQRELYKVTSIELADENLSVTKFQNGDPIPEALTPEQWVEFGKKEIPAFMRNGDDFHYNHFAVADKRGLAPEGWRVPTEQDMEYIMQNGLWKDLPKTGSRIFVDGSVDFAGSFGFYWSSTVGGYFASYLYFDSSNINVYSNFRAYGFSVRCIRSIN